MEGVNISGVKYLSLCHLTDIIEGDIASSPGFRHAEMREGLSVKFRVSIHLLSLRISKFMSQFCCFKLLK